MHKYVQVSNLFININQSIFLAFVLQEFIHIYLFVWLCGDVLIIKLHIYCIYKIG